MRVLFLMPSSLRKKNQPKKIVGTRILIHSTSTLHMVSFLAFPAGLCSTSANPSPLALPGRVPLLIWFLLARKDGRRWVLPTSWGKTSLRCQHSLWCVPLIKKTGFLWGKRFKGVLSDVWSYAEVRTLLIDFLTQQNHVQKEETSSPPPDPRYSSSLWKKKGKKGKKIWLQAVRLQPACQTALCRNTIHVDFTEKVVIHISPLIYCFLTSSLC